MVISRRQNIIVTGHGQHALVENGDLLAQPPDMSHGMFALAH
jgi:hypothetical protein